MPKTSSFLHRHKYHLVFGALAFLIGVVVQYLPMLIEPDPGIRPMHFRTLWSYPTKKQILSSILVGDLLLFGTDRGHLEAISSVDGHLVWSLKFPFAIFSLAQDKNGTVYVGTGLHDNAMTFLSAVDPALGKIIWQRQFAGHLEEPPAIDEEHHRLWVGAGPGSLWALDTRDGSVLWHQAIGHLDATPLLYNDVVYVPAQKSETLHESFFYALRPSDGQILWKLDQPGQPWATPLIDKMGHVLLTTTAEGQIGVARSTDKGWAQGLSLDGKNVWRRSLPDMALSPNIYVPELDRVIYVTKNGTVIALLPQDGSTLWETKVAKSFSAPGALMTYAHEKRVAVTSDDGVFSVLDPRTGSLMFAQKLAPSASTAPLVDDDHIYITTNFGITALQPISGERHE